MGDLNGINVSDVFGLKEPLTKLMECVSSGIGKIYEPTHIKRMAKAKQEEIKLIGESLAENINLPSTYANGELTIDTSSADELIKRTGNRVLFTEIRRQQNIESIIANTYNLLNDEEKVSEDPVNPDWLFTFFNYAGDISDENMQKLWSEILAGEIKKPNTYSLRTLNTLKNITTLEANLYQKLCPFIFHQSCNPFLYNDTELFSKYNIKFSDLLKLEDCGLINLNGFITINFEEGQNTINNKQIILIINGKLEIGVYRLTESGTQILNIIQNSMNYNNNYFLDLCNNLKERNSQTTFNAYYIESINDSEIFYDEKKDLLK